MSFVERILLQVPEQEVRVREVSSKTTIQLLAEELAEARDRGLFNYLRKIKKRRLFGYFLVVQAVVFLSFRVQIQFPQAVALMVGVLLVFFLNERDRSINTGDFKELELKLEQMRPKPKNFYLDANLIDLFYELRSFQAKNRPVFRKLIQITDDFLGVRRDLERGVRRCKENLDLAKQFRMHALNTFHSLIYSLGPQQVVLKKYTTALRTFNLYLKRHMDEMIEMCQKQYAEEGWHRERGIVSHFDAPRPAETDYNQNYNVYV